MISKLNINGHIVYVHKIYRIFKSLKRRKFLQFDALWVTDYINIVGVYDPYQFSTTFGEIRQHEKTDELPILNPLFNIYESAR